MPARGCQLANCISVSIVYIINTRLPLPKRPAVIGLYRLISRVLITVLTNSYRISTYEASREHIITSRLYFWPSPMLLCLGSLSSHVYIKALEGI